jgi:flotillin
MLALIIVASALAVVAIVAFAVWAHQYTKVGPNEVLIISGRRRARDGAAPSYRLLRGGGTYVRPFREKVQRLSLELMQFDVRVPETYTVHGVPVQIDGVCMVKIEGSEAGIGRAAEQFLSRTREDIVRTALQTVEGHMRAAVGGLSVEDIYRERQRLVAAVRELAEPDLARMGLTIVSLTVRSIADKQGYLEALGRPRTAQVKRDAIRGEAEADREARAARFEADRAIESSRRDFELARAAFKAEGRRASADADLAYDLQHAITRQQLRAEELMVDIVERRRAIELMEAEVQRRRNELEAEVVQPALARAREIVALAESERERAAATGAGEAEALRLRGLAEADAMAAKARSWGDYNEAAITDRVLEVLPALASAVSAPLARTDKIVMIGGNGASSGAPKITSDVTAIVAQLPEVLEALTGMKLGDLAQRVPGLRDDRAGGQADADGAAEELR